MLKLLTNTYQSGVESLYGRIIYCLNVEGFYFLLPKNKMNSNMVVFVRATVSEEEWFAVNRIYSNY